MSISAYVGLPGHGKSYGVVENVIIPALRTNRMVFTNIPMEVDKCMSDFGCTPVPFSTEDIIKNPNWFTDVFIAGSIFVFDEVYDLWPSGLKANNVLQSHKDFLAKHRHFVGENGYSTEIYLVTQDLGQVASFARALVETTYIMVKRLNIGLDKRFRVDIYEGCVTGVKPPVSKRMREIHGGKFKEDVYQYYKSHTKSVAGYAGNESRVDTRNNALGRTSIKLGFALFILCLVAVYFGFSKVTAMYGEPEPLPKPVQQPVINQPQQSAPVKTAPKQSLPKNPKFLANAKHFFISMQLSVNDVAETYFQVVFADSQVMLSSRDLKKMGYRLTPFNNCTIKVQGYDFSGYALCGKLKTNSGIADKFVASVAPDLQK